VHQVDDEVRIEVADEGPGVAAAERTKVWKPYQRGRSAGHTAGSGIGLAVVCDVATAHGGRAWIEDAPNGVGALFIIALPAAGEASPAMASAKPATTAPQPVAG
jgi:signal transduction histidine kinase